LNVKVQALEGRVRIDVDEEHVVLPASIADAVHCSLRQSIFSPESLPRTVPLEDRQAMCIALWQISAVRREETPVDGRASPAQLVKLQRSDGVA
jgi:hypothetical protein